MRLIPVTSPTSLGISSGPFARAGAPEGRSRALLDEGYLDLKEALIDGSLVPAKPGGVSTGKTKGVYEMASSSVLSVYSVATRY